LCFDAAALAREAAALPAEAWTSHFNAGYHDGGWSGVALRAPGGDATRLYPDPQGLEPYVDTPLRAACPAADAVLREFGAALRSARLLRLAPGGCIREHRDYGLSYEEGEARLHLPVSTEAGVEFYLDGELMPMEPGECWYLNLDLPHRVQNLGTQDRVHLVVDCVVDDWLRAQVPDAATLERQRDLLRHRAAALDSSLARLDRLRDVLLSDAALLDALATEDDPVRFVGLVLAEGQRRGLAFTGEDMRAAMSAGRREWIERWVLR
jgi:hypothetical protein